MKKVKKDSGRNYIRGLSKRHTGYVKMTDPYNNVYNNNYNKKEYKKDYKEEYKKDYKEKYKKDYKEEGKKENKYNIYAKKNFF